MKVLKIVLAAVVIAIVLDLIASAFSGGDGMVRILMKGKHLNAWW